MYVWRYDKQKHSFFARDIVAFRVTVTVPGGYRLQQNVVAKLRNSNIYFKQATFTDVT